MSTLHTYPFVSRNLFSTLGFARHQTLFSALIWLASFSLQSTLHAQTPNSEQHSEDSSKFIIFDLSTNFNARTWAPANDRRGEGFRGGLNEKYVSNAFPLHNKILTANKIPFRLGPVDGPDNSILVKLDYSPCRINLDQKKPLNRISFLTIGVGLNPAKAPLDNGSAVVRIGYMDKTVSEEQFIFRNFYVAEPKQPAFSAAVTDLLDQSTFRPNRHVYGQTVIVNPNRVVDYIEFDFSGIVDGSGTDAEFAILAITGKL